jgi:hypothetical protein
MPPMRRRRRRVLLLGVAIKFLVSTGLATTAVARWECVFDDSPWCVTLVETGHTLELPATVKLSGLSADNYS